MSIWCTSVRPAPPILKEQVIVRTITSPKRISEIRSIGSRNRLTDLERSVGTDLCDTQFVCNKSIFRKLSADLMRASARCPDGCAFHATRGGKRYSVSAKIRYTIRSCTPRNHADRPLFVTNEEVIVARSIITIAPGQ